MSGLRVWVEGVGLAGPGLASWPSSVDVLRGMQPYTPASTVLPPPARLPPAERRRAGAAVKLALAIADEAVAQAQVDPALLATVFTSSSGEGTNCHALCETLATPTPMVSPTRFTNSVHNAASGCWHIAVGSRASSTSLCAFDGSFGAGLIEAATSVVLGRAPLLLVASDSPYPEPLHATRSLPDHFGLALVLAPAPSARSIAALTITLIGADEPATLCADPAIDHLREVIPAAAALPLLIAIAQKKQADRVVLAYLAGSHLQIDLG
ncbi:MAG: beta-ketoacyl synthase chain length factor [Pseudomonadota bacterium]